MATLATFIATFISTFIWTLAMALDSILPGGIWNFTVTFLPFLPLRLLDPLEARFLEKILLVASQLEITYRLHRLWDHYVLDWRSYTYYFKIEFELPSIDGEHKTSYLIEFTLFPADKKLEESYLKAYRAAWHRRRRRSNRLWRRKRFLRSVALVAQCLLVTLIVVIRYRFFK